MDLSQYPFVCALVACVFVTNANAFDQPPSICAWEPASLVPAGGIVSGRVGNAWARRCQAVLRFADPTFLPIAWLFNPIHCAGHEVAEFKVPLGVPNGDAFVTWCHPAAPLSACSKH